MTNSERICSELGKLYFFKELEKSNLVYTTDKDNQERELADTVLRVGNYILMIQIKEMEDTSKDIQKWIKNKVFRVAKNQIKKTYKQAIEKIVFKDKKNHYILENIDDCTIIPIIIFDIKDKVIKYKKNCKTESGGFLIHIFDMKDFRYLCENIICPMEIVRYIDERKKYLKYKQLILGNEHNTIIVKTENEEEMIELYYNKYELNRIERSKILKFHTYLTLFEEHCIKKENYEIFIKIMSQFYMGKIDFLIERIDFIIEKAYKNELDFNRYIIDNQQSVLFFSIPRDTLDVEYIDFISNLFMYKFKKESVLTIVAHSLTNDNYELDFAVCYYEHNKVELLEKALNTDYLNYWNNTLNKKC